VNEGTIASRNYLILFSWVGSTRVPLQCGSTRIKKSSLHHCRLCMCLLYSNRTMSVAHFEDSRNASAVLQSPQCNGFCRSSFITADRCKDSMILPQYNSLSSSNSGIKHLSPEESSLCPFNDLLVYRLRWMVHHNCALFVVNLCVDSGVPDEVDDPLLTFVLIKTQSGGEIP